jgi:hypothetical protein
VERMVTPRQPERIDNGVDLALSWPRSHRYDRRCPECGQDCTREAIVRLAYTFEVCRCPEPDYPHLVERLHHRACIMRPFASGTRWQACMDDLRCCRNDGHEGDHLYPDEPLVKLREAQR